MPDLEQPPLPRHVALIMDGNGRWAEERGLPRTAGHRAGTENIRTVIEAFGERGIEYLTLYAFSTENWGRPKREVDGLMRIFAGAIRNEVQPLHKAGIQIRWIGQIDVLPNRLRKQIEEAVELTSKNKKMIVCAAFNYGARAEIVDAVQRIVREGIEPDAINEQLITSRLYTADLPDPDLIIRTGGEWRLSNFLLWQAAYAEYHSTESYWPDFSKPDIDEALTVYQHRVRKFGSLTKNSDGELTENIPQNSTAAPKQAAFATPLQAAIYPRTQHKRNGS